MKKVLTAIALVAAVGSAPVAWGADFRPGPTDVDIYVNTAGDAAGHAKACGFDIKDIMWRDVSDMMKRVGARGVDAARRDFEKGWDVYGHVDCDMSSLKNSMSRLNRWRDFADLVDPR